MAFNFFCLNIQWISRLYLPKKKVTDKSSFKWVIQQCYRSGLRFVNAQLKNFIAVRSNFREPLKPWNKFH